MKALLPLLALAACQQDPTQFVYIAGDPGGEIYAQRKELDRQTMYPIVRFIMRISDKESYSVTASIFCGTDRIGILRSDHYKNHAFVSRGEPYKPVWLDIPEDTPGAKLEAAVCPKSETI